jgi:hypothetical protein
MSFDKTTGNEIGCNSSTSFVKGLGKLKCHEKEGEKIIPGYVYP